MITCEPKPMEEVLQYVKGEESVFLYGCAGCAEVCETSGEAHLQEVAGALKKKGITVAGMLTTEFLCSKALVGLRLIRHGAEVEKADSVVVFACGVGVQSVAAVVDRPVHPATNSTPESRGQGLWRSEERCAQCGDCVLDWTGGLCPITGCAKGLLNGACGGSEKGKCEVSPDRDCVWTKIYERLKATGRLSLLSSRIPPKKWGKMALPPEVKGTLFWALEAEETPEGAEEGKAVAR